MFVSRWKRIRKYAIPLLIFIFGYITGMWLPNQFQERYIPVKESEFVKQNAQWSHGHFDVTGKFKILPYLSIAEKWGVLSQDEGSVCAAVQSSLDHAAWLPRFIKSWPGPISYAIFAPGPQFHQALDFIQYLNFCFPDVKKQVSFHVVHPTGMPPPSGKRVPVTKDALLHWCQFMTPVKVINNFGLHTTTERHAESPHWSKSIQYPQNVLRNVARDHCQTYWLITPDIDMLFPKPSPNIQPSIYQRLSEFLVSSYTSQCQRCAYVIPVYEIREHTESIPSDKAELLRLIDSNQSRQYHVELFRPNQELSELDKWERLSSRNDVTVAYKVPKFEFYYEPIYIAKRGTPKFDERFVGYGMVRNTQTYEMHLAGYTFLVLDNIFLSHWGYKTSRDLPETRVLQTKRNNHLFCASILKQLQAKYANYKKPTNLICWA